MHTKSTLAAALCAVAIAFTSCIIPGGYEETDTYDTYQQNLSSHNIYIQYYYTPAAGDATGVYGIASEYLTKTSAAQSLYGVFTPGAAPAVDRVLFVDTDTHRLLKRIDGATFNAAFTLIETVEDITGSFGFVDTKIKHHDHYFIITDAFLAGS
jgi:hypothetical protein